MSFTLKCLGFCLKNSGVLLRIYSVCVCVCLPEQGAGVLSMEMSAISGGPLAVILGTSVTINTFLNSEAKTESPGSPESVHSSASLHPHLCF